MQRLGAGFYQGHVCLISDAHLIVDLDGLDLQFFRGGFETGTPKCVLVRTATKAVFAAGGNFEFEWLKKRGGMLAHFLTDASSAGSSPNKMRFDMLMPEALGIVRDPYCHSPLGRKENDDVKTAERDHMECSPARTG